MNGLLIPTDGTDSPTCLSPRSVARAAHATGLRVPPWVASAVLGGASLVSNVEAAPVPEFSPGYGKCLEKAGAVDPEVAKCMSTEWAVQDRRLNVSYKALLGTLPAERRTQLQAAQRAWLKFVQANCGFYNDPGGGSSARQAAHECEIRARSQRASELDDLRLSQ